MPNGKNHPLRLPPFWPSLVAAFVLAAMPLSAFPMISAVQAEVLPAGAMKPYQAATIALAGTPLDEPLNAWLDWCCDHAW